MSTQRVVCQIWQIQLHAICIAVRISLADLAEISEVSLLFANQPLAHLHLITCQQGPELAAGTATESSPQNDPRHSHLPTLDDVNWQRTEAQTQVLEASG